MDKIADFIGVLLVTAFMLGWLNIFGAQYTWWALIAWLGGAN